MKLDAAKPRREPEPRPPLAPIEEPPESRNPPLPYDDDQPTPARPFTTTAFDDDARERRSR